MFKNNCQRIYVTFSYIYIFTYYQHTINIFTSHFSYIYIFHNYQSFLTFLFFTCYIRLFACYLFNCYIHVIYILYTYCTENIQLLYTFLDTFWTCSGQVWGSKLKFSQKVLRTFGLSFGIIGGV